jgi:HEAT repeat protein
MWALLVCVGIAGRAHAEPPDPAVGKAICKAIQQLHSDNHEQMNGVVALIEIGEAAIPPLLEVVEGPDEAALAAALIALEHLARTPTVRVQLAGALGRVLVRKQTPGRHRILHFLSRWEEDAWAAFPYLEETSRDKDPSVRESALSVWWTLSGNPKALQLLLRSAEDPDVSVRRKALSALQARAEDVPPSAAELGLRVLGDKDSGVREAGWTLLRALDVKADRLLPILVLNLRDPDAGVRHANARMLHYLGKEASPALRALVGALDDKEQEVRYQVVRTLQAIGPDAGLALPDLCRILPTADPATGRAIAELIAGLGPDAEGAVPYLCGALSNEAIAVFVYDALLEIDPRTTASFPIPTGWSRGLGSSGSSGPPPVPPPSGPPPMPEGR